jgi:hypothetical protein
MECVYCAVRTGSLNIIKVLSFITDITYTVATKYPVFQKNGSPAHQFSISDRPHKLHAVSQPKNAEFSHFF